MRLAMKCLIIWIILFISIDAQTGIFNPIISTVYNLLTNSDNIINAIVNIQQLPDLLHEIFRQLNNGTHPLWIIENTLHHTLLVAQKLPKFGSTIRFTDFGWYDFIVVGAGTAGAVIASRLSENPSVSVLLLEAGGPENIVTDIPIMFPFLARSPWDWAFLTQPQNNCFLNIENQRVPWQRGKVMGGTSGINGMVYVRGVPRDYNNWAKITGDSSWSYNNVLPYFLKSEVNLDPEFCADTKYHNCNDGFFPVNSNWKSNENPVSRTVIQAASEFGISQIDLNRPQSIYYGCNGAQQALLNGNRVTVSKAFLESVKPFRPNLDIIAFAYVKRVIFSNKRAIGVEYDRLLFPFRVYARREVILAAGSIMSPHILLHSGVGPSQQLQNLNIPVVANLPGVGENLKDHVNTIGIGYSLPSIGLWPISINSLISYFLLRKGPLGYLDDVQMLVSSSINTYPDWPDIQINSITIPIGFEPTGVLVRNVFGVRLDVFYQMYLPHFLQPSFFLWADVTRPRSRGNLYLQSNDPYDYPIIQPNYLSHPDDIKILIDATRWLFRFGNTNAFKYGSVKAFPELTVGCESIYSLVNDPLFPNMKVPNDAYIECHARHMTTTPWHYVGTCKMGRVSDPMAVVDTQLRVLGGITNLRVIDSSIMPEITDGNTNGPTMMIAEKGAQMIRNTYNI